MTSDKKKFALGDEGPLGGELPSFADIESFAAEAPSAKSGSRNEPNTATPSRKDKSPRKLRPKDKPARPPGKPRLPSERDDQVAKLVRIDSRLAAQVQKAADSLQQAKPGKGNFNRMLRLILREYFEPRR